MKLQNLKSPKTGKTVANQFLITDFGGAGISDVFISYETTIAMAVHSTRVIYLNKVNYSRTTTKYTREFLSQYKNYRIVEVEEDYFD